MSGRNHMASMRLENAGRSALNLDDRGGLNSIIDAGFIDIVGNAYTVLAVSLAPFYKIGTTEQRNQIDNFLERYHYLSDTELEKTEYYSGVEESAGALRELVSQLS